jgi:hypothetical protein
MAVGELPHLPQSIRDGVCARSNQDIRPKRGNLLRQELGLADALERAGPIEAIDAALKQKSVRVIFIGK